MIDALEDARRTHGTGLWRCRLLVSASGAATVECTPHQDDPRVWNVAFSTAPVDEQDPFLFNETTRRVVYEGARRIRPDVDDVLLWNTRGEVTESTVANLVIELDGVRVTPPITSGLLGGVFRRQLLENDEISERVITRADVERSTRLWLTNSVRGWIDTRLVQ